ncbi:alpha-D-ribose 1-methylphosphonate 5-triphosphate synthase subunit PhnH [Desulfotomaculum arcticum]|uniref:Alpha-D-ribose 1-methylphosphonate 5-triphosphate synthase subunit PhnH n=1 Tax=Desulfotruncus arcticus DSM 17038 TaxID=1121424 RepID=A0A1I2V3Y7_9FIRM|nr:phosphonate C-P lyase system protein PhnH [Desulfotruncus arcticus]SFG83149.1 alpha-D-ribose 1-methylphosphonate 5-triphosphate synthase subunit PhnH [Desulfotomaculum arcticum] [Desulfotruncus arcticus DSM 17038]
MKLDLVHDIQRVYRKTVDAMSRPGLIVNIKDQAEKVDLEVGCFKSTVLLAMMLLDTETTFKVVSEREAEIAKFINHLTYAKGAETQSAGFILVLHDAKPLSLEETLKTACPGDLVDPHQSATIIVEADNLGYDGDLLLTGPGIDGERWIKVQTAGSWVDIRAEKNSEYPLGIDLIFTDANDNVLCIPRTTQITKRVVG